MDISVLSSRVTCDFKNNIVLLEPYEFQEPIHEPAASQTVVGIKNALDKDALEAVKMDPAVLEAQVTVREDPKNKLAEIDGDAESVSDSHIVMRKKDPSALKSDFFEKMMHMHKAALLSLKSDQFELLMKFVATLRQQRVSVQKCLECAFCKNNGESVSWYSAHALRDGRGRVRCPVLRAVRCPRCGATGDRAHTIRYCPEEHAL